MQGKLRAVIDESEGAQGGGGDLREDFRGHLLHHGHLRNIYRQLIIDCKGKKEVTCLLLGTPHQAS